MTQYFERSSFSTRSLYKLDVYVTTTAISGGTQVYVEAFAVRTGSEITVPFSNPGGSAERSYSVPGGRVGSLGGSLAESATLEWVFDFGPAGGTTSSNPYEVVVWGGFNRFIPTSYGSSTTVTITASHSPTVGSASVSIPISLFVIPEPVISGSFDDATTNSSYYDTVTASNSPDSWSIDSGSLPPGLNGSSSGSTFIIDGTPNSAGVYDFTLKASNSGGDDTKNFSITVSRDAQFVDQNFGGTLRVGSYYSMTVSALYSNNITVSGYPNSLSPNQFTSGSYRYFRLSGTISLSNLNGSSTQYNVSMTASAADGIGDSDSASDTLTVKDGLPEITGSLDSSMRVGESYSDSLSKNEFARNVSNSGDITSNGLSFSNSSLNLSGTPISDGSYSISVTGQNNSSETDTYSQTFNVLPRLPIWIDNTISTLFSIDEPYSDSISADYAVAYEVTSGSLPTGITLNQSTGELSGTPTTASQYLFTLGARNSADEYIYTQDYNITVQESGGNLITYNGSAWEENEVYAYQGGSWVRGRVYYYDGTNWVKSLEL